MLIGSVVKNEAARNAQMIEQYEAQIAVLPKGSLISRRGYFYLKFRRDGKVCDEYIGKDPSKVSELQEQLAFRKHCETMLSTLKQEQKKIHKLLEELI